MSQKGIRITFTQVSEKSSHSAYLRDAVTCSLNNCCLTSKENATRSSETPHTIKSHILDLHMAFITRHTCHAQQEN